jgi:hypothetical protein
MNGFKDTVFVGDIIVFATAIELVHGIMNSLAGVARG